DRSPSQAPRGRHQGKHPIRRSHKSPCAGGVFRAWMRCRVCCNRIAGHNDEARRAMDAAGHGSPMRCDPVTLEILRGALRATLAEMEAVIERTAMSPFIREKKDFFAALLDGDGRLVIGSGLPITGDVIAPIAEHYPPETMAPGDIYWFNDCYGSAGAVSHSPDLVLVAPVFAEGRLVAYAQCWAHFSDIGGMRPGSMSPDCTEIFQEGIIVPPVRIARDGVILDDLLRVFYRNS